MESSAPFGLYEGYRMRRLSWPLKPDVRKFLDPSLHPILPSKGRRSPRFVGGSLCFDVIVNFHSIEVDGSLNPVPFTRLALSSNLPLSELHPIFQGHIADLFSSSDEIISDAASSPPTRWCVCLPPFREANTLTLYMNEEGNLFLGAPITDYLLELTTKGTATFDDLASLIRKRLTLRNAHVSFYERNAEGELYTGFPLRDFYNKDRTIYEIPKISFRARLE